MSALKSDSFRRLQLGIGRPLSREPDVVADYVLKDFSTSEKAALKVMFENAYNLLVK